MLGVDRSYDCRYSSNAFRKSIGIFAINSGKSGDSKKDKTDICRDKGEGKTFTFRT